MLSCALTVWWSANLYGQTLRSDIQQKLHRSICTQETTPPRELWWKHQIFDAQINGSIVKSPNNPRLTISTLQQLAISRAKKHDHQGFAVGLCNPQKGWLMTTPNSRPVTKNQGQLHIPLKPFQSHCRQFRIDFMSQAGQFKDLTNLGTQTNHALLIDTQSLPSGMITLRCFPMNHAWQGPVLWALIPNHLEDMTPPVRLNTKARHGDQMLFDWINEIRKFHKLAALQYADSIQTSLDQLSTTQELTHDRRQIAKARRRLADSGFSFVGENRALGKSPLEISQLFWMSPTHRQLLLDPTATHLGVKIQKKDQVLFSLVVLAKNLKK